MIQLTAQTRILVALEPADFRCGIDGLARLCRAELRADPMSGIVFVFTNRKRTGVRLLAYDGWGFWLCYKRLSKGKFRWWPRAGDTGSTRMLAHELQVLLCGGDPSVVKAAPIWRRVDSA